eukprot:RCo040808
MAQARARLLSRLHSCYVASFFFLCVWVFGVCSTAMQDWWYLSPMQYREGLWYGCIADYCVSNLYEYTGDCNGKLSAVRCFNILTIIFGFLTCLFGLFQAFDKDGVGPFIVLLGFLALASTCLTWPIYLGFLSECMSLGVSKGSGFAFAVTTFPCAFLGFLFLLYGMIPPKKKKKVEEPKPKPPAPPAPKLVALPVEPLCTEPPVPMAPAMCLPALQSTCCAAPELVMAQPILSVCPDCPSV